MKEQQAVSALQDSLKENGIETRKLPRAAALRVSFMGSYHRVTYAGEGKGWLVNGYNEDGDPVKISELRSLCEELSPVAITPVAEEAIGQPPSESDDVEIFTPGEEIEKDAIGIPTPGEEVEIFTPGEEIEESRLDLFLESVKSVCDEEGWSISQVDHESFEIITNEDAIAPNPESVNPESVKRRHYLKWIRKLSNLSNVEILSHEAEFLKDPENCPLADLKKIVNRFLSLPTAIDEMRSRKDDDHGEPINYRPAAEAIR